MHRKKGFIDDPNAPEQYTQLVQFGLDNTMTNVEAIAERIIVSNQTGANKITSTLTVRPNSSGKYILYCYSIKRWSGI